MTPSRRYSKRKHKKKRKHDRFVYINGGPDGTRTLMTGWTRILTDCMIKDAYQNLLGDGIVPSRPHPTQCSFVVCSFIPNPGDGKTYCYVFWSLYFYYTINLTICQVSWHYCEYFGVKLDVGEGRLLTARRRYAGFDTRELRSKLIPFRHEVSRYLTNKEKCGIIQYTIYNTIIYIYISN